MRWRGGRRKIIKTAVENKLQSTGSASHRKRLLLRPKRREAVMDGMQGIMSDGGIQNKMGSKARSQRLKTRGRARVIREEVKI